jgi:hypothetical protein
MAGGIFHQANDSRNPQETAQTLALCLARAAWFNLEPNE